MLPKVASMLIIIVLGAPPAYGQGVTPFAVPSGQSGLVIDHGGGLQTYRDSTGEQGAVIGLGNGLSIYRDSHGSTGPSRNIGPDIRRTQGSEASPRLEDARSERLRDAQQDHTLSGR